MESGNKGYSEMRATNLKFVAQCRGNRFDVVVRGLKGYYGLMLCPYALVKGDRLVLTPVQAGATAAFGRLQLFARVLVPHPERGVYETVWEKLVSPPGVMVLTEYLQSNLGVCITTSHLGSSDWTEQELAYFDFASATVNYPGRGQNTTQRVDAVKSPPSSIQTVAESFLGAQTQQRPGVDPATSQRKNLLTPSNPVRSGSLVAHAAGPQRRDPLPEPGGAPKPSQTQSIYGMEVSNEEMDLVELLNRPRGRPSAEPPRPTTGRLEQEETKGEGKGGLRGTVTMLIRTLASHMSDSDPTNSGKT